MRTHTLVAGTFAAVALAAAAAAPAHAVIRSEGRLDRGEGFLPLRLTVRNTGDETFSVMRFTGRAGHAFGTPAPSSGSCTRAVTAAGPSLFCNAPVAPGATFVVVFNAEPRYPERGGGLLGVQAASRTRGSTSRRSPGRTRRRPRPRPPAAPSASSRSAAPCGSGCAARTAS